MESRWERPLTPAGRRTPAHEKWVLTARAGNLQNSAPVRKPVDTTVRKEGPSASSKARFFNSRPPFAPTRVLHNKSYVFERIHTMRFSLYEIVFRQSAIYNMQSAKNHNMKISLYDIFFCPSAIYSIQSAKNHNVKCV